MADIYYKINKKTREDLVETVKRVAVEILEGPKETWLSGEEVSKMFPFFSTRWLKDYGHLLPRKRVEVEGKNGAVVRSRWYYSRNQILRMIRDNDVLRFEDIKD